MITAKMHTNYYGSANVCARSFK